MMDNLSDVSLMELETDCEWDPDLADVLYSDVSLVELKPEREDSLVPEPAPEIEREKEKLPVASGSRCKRSTAPGRPRRNPKKLLKPRTQDMILDGVYWTDSKPESIEDGCLLLAMLSTWTDNLSTMKCCQILKPNSYSNVKS